MDEPAVGQIDQTGVLELPDPPVTGDPAVDDAVARLAGLPGVPLEDHPAMVEAVHRALTDRLADVEG